jgi:hypothetical protein
MLVGVGLEIDNPRLVHFSDLRPTERRRPILGTIRPVRKLLSMKSRHNESYCIHAELAEQRESDLIETPGPVVNGYNYRLLWGTAAFVKMV